MYRSPAHGISRYAQVGIHTGVEGASPHRLILMLLDGALGRIAAARGAMERKDIPEKCRLIGKAMDIVMGLQGSLDKERGGELAERLDALYEYMLKRLLEANLRNQSDILDEVSNLLGEIKEGWTQIADVA